MPKKSPKHIFKKLFYSYSAVILCIVLALVLYFISSTRSRLQATNLNYMKMMNEKSVSYLEECEEKARQMQNELYQSEALLDDLVHYLQSDEEEYWKYRLEVYVESASFDYNGYDGFVQRILEVNPNILSIELISYDRMELTACYQGDRNYKSRDIRERMQEIEEGNLAGEGAFSFQQEIRNLKTLESVGCFLITFKADEFAEIKNYYSMADMIVYNQFGTVVFNTSSEYAPEMIKKAAGEGNGGEQLNAYMQMGMVKDYTVCSLLDKREANYLPPSLFLTIIGIGAGVMIMGEVFVNFHLRHLTKRLQHIIEGMNEVTTGDLSVRLNADQDGDELDLISDHFNEMCLKLDRYIQISYLAEIEQKNAELEVLQNQINPHFLYNTLEAIRMKAISNGDREVGKMLYSMAVIFRSQLKEADVITVIQEIHYCKKYMELFEYRFKGKFKSSVECPEELMGYPIIKFILQPVIENYFIHGLRAEDEGNEIRIQVEKQEDSLVVHVTDNGRGMDEEEMFWKNRELRENRMGVRKTIGLMNVNRRIKAVYGGEFGLSLSQSNMGGMHVCVKVGLGNEIV